MAVRAALRTNFFHRFHLHLHFAAAEQVPLVPRAAVVAAAWSTACTASEPMIRAAAPTWVTTGSVIRARDVNYGIDEKKTPVPGRGFPLYVTSHSQNLQGGKSRL